MPLDPPTESHQISSYSIFYTEPPSQGSLLITFMPSVLFPLQHSMGMLCSCALPFRQSSQELCGGIDSAPHPQCSLLFLWNLQEFRSSLTKFVDIVQQIEKGRGHGQNLCCLQALGFITKLLKRQINSFPRMCDLDRSQVGLARLWMKGREGIQPWHRAAGWARAFLQGLCTVLYPFSLVEPCNRQHFGVLNNKHSKWWQKENSLIRACCSH